MTDAAGRIKARALELGFSHAGIARSGPLGEEAEHLHQWLSRGYQGTMEWMNRHPERRSDPSNILPGAKSVVAVAMNYYTGAQHTQDPGTGKISRYAWGDDYHEIVSERLEVLRRWVEGEFPGAACRIYVDTGPVMEKVWAQRAGIGWEGKHTNVITRDRGSWVFLGELITTLELEADAPATDHCGTCTLCIEACPTGAIVEPYVVDSNRCISYLTIEHRGPVTGEAADQFEGWIYGCDVCQDVCPWNGKFSAECGETRFAPREDNLAPPLERWGEMSQEEFTRRFKGSPIKRTKRDGLVRNVALARHGRGAL